MADTINDTKPCLVQTAQGFTISYKQKFLYSKYAPSKAINQIIQNLNILPQTIVLCVSPILEYGLQELSEKLPQDCIMLACEYEPELFEAMAEQNVSLDSPNFSFLAREELLELGPLLTKRNVTLKSGFTLPCPGTFKRIIRVDFSAGAQFGGSIYDKVLENATNALMTFWANRVTLVKFGRRYSTNFFKNLGFIARTGTTVPVQKYFGSVEKTIIVFGAGESTAKGIAQLKKQEASGTNIREKYFIICADTAAQPLIKQGIIPDGVFIEETQNVISKCFIGIQSEDIHIFAGLSSLHSITRYFKPEQISFFTTEFVQAEFIDRFEKLGVLPPKNPPFGSVGITAYYYATIFRKNESVPIQTFGLDFSYSAGRTHTKGAMADNARFMNSNRLKTDANFAASFNETAFEKCTLDDGTKMYTTPILDRYEKLMKEVQRGKLVGEAALRPFDKLRTAQAQGPQKALQKEKEELIELRALLTGEKEISADKRQEEITRRVMEREYLYLHFPDGHKFSYTQSFLNRVRVEVEFFIKAL